MQPKVSERQFAFLKQKAEDGVYKLFSLDRYASYPAFMQKQARESWFDPKYFLKVLSAEEQYVYSVCTQYCSNVPEGTAILALHYMNESINAYMAQEAKRLQPSFNAENKAINRYNSLKGIVDIKAPETIKPVRTYRTPNNKIYPIFD